MVRALLHQLVTLVASLVIALVLAGILFTARGRPPATAFFVDGPDLLFGFLDVGIAVWALLLLVGGVRRSGFGWGRAGTLLAAVFAALAGIVVVSVVSLRGAAGPADAVWLATQAGALLVVGAVVGRLIADRIVRVAPPAVDAGEADAGSD